MTEQRTSEQRSTEGWTTCHKHEIAYPQGGSCHMCVVEECSPKQLRHDAETCDELKQGPFAHDFRWAAGEIERLRWALNTIADGEAEDFSHCIEIAEEAVRCNCGWPGPDYGPHDPDCIWWNKRA